MRLNATRFLRKMRGGAQAHLLSAQGPNGTEYFVTKFIENPQHRRILVNEWIAAKLLDYLQIAAPAVAVIELEQRFLDANPDVHLQFGSQKVPIAPGWHLGSRFPGNPSTEAVYDYLPDSLLPQVVNLRDFAAILAFDRWAGNSDARQAIFFRRRIRDWLDKPDIAPTRKGFVAQMVDHGYIFDGPHWTLTTAPLQGLYPRPLVYEQVRTFDDFQPWLDRIRHLPDTVLDEALRSVPEPWLDSDRDSLEQLLEALWKRRAKVESFIEDTLRARPQSFPSWVR